MPTIARLDAEELARPERRASLPFLHVLRLYLDPSPLFKNASAGTRLEQAMALEYNRRNRCILPVYAQRWSVIALLSFLGLAWLGAAAQADPLLCVPILGCALALAVAVAAVLVNLAVYVVLGIAKSP